MNKFTLTFNNGLLEEMYAKRGIPDLKSWTQKMSGVVFLIGLVSIGFIIKAETTSYKAYLSQVLMAGSALSTIILLQFRPMLLNYIHTINCTIYMFTVIWTYVDNDFYRDPSSDYLNGYIQGLAIYVYIVGTRCMPKLYLISLLFLTISFCNGKDQVTSHFIQITPLWLLFLYKVHNDERLNRNLFLSQQQEQVYKYIIQNVLPNGLYLLKYDRKQERIELHSSNQKPKILSYLKNNEEVRHLLKNTILAKNEMELSSILQNNTVSWQNTLDGHLRRKINQAISWGEKRYINLKDKNVIKAKGSISKRSNNDTDIQNSTLNNNSFNLEVVPPSNSGPTSKLTIPPSESEIQFNFNNTNQMQMQQSSAFKHKKEIPKQFDEILSKENLFNSRTNIPSQMDANFPRGTAYSLVAPSPIKVLMNSLSPTSKNGTFFRDTINSSQTIGMVGNLQINENSMNRQQKVQMKQSQYLQLSSVAEVAHNMLVNSQNIEIRSNQIPELYQKSQYKEQSFSKQSVEPPQNPKDQKDPANPYTDLVEYFCGVYKKGNDIDFKLNLRLSTFYLNDIYGVISIEDESFKNKYLSKERQYSLILSLFSKTIKDINNQVVACLYNIHTQSINHQNRVNDSMYNFLRLKCKLDNYYKAISIISGSGRIKRILISECSEFMLLKELKPFIQICKLKSKSKKIKIFIDYSNSIVENNTIFTNKGMLLLLLHNIIFNAIENTPSLGIIAIRIDYIKDFQQIKFKICNTTTYSLYYPSATDPNAVFLNKFQSPISLEQMYSDAKSINKPQLGLRLCHQMLGQIGPTSNIIYSANQQQQPQQQQQQYQGMSASINNRSNNNNNYNNNLRSNSEQLDLNKDKSSFSSSCAFDSNPNTLFQKFFIYKDMQPILCYNQKGKTPSIINHVQTQIGSARKKNLEQQKGNLQKLQSFKKKIQHLTEPENSQEKYQQIELTSIQFDKSQDKSKPKKRSTFNHNEDQPKQSNESRNKFLSIASNYAHPPLSGNGSNQSCMLTYESNESFKQWISEQQYKCYSKPTSLKNSQTHAIFQDSQRMQQKEQYFDNENDCDQCSNDSSIPSGNINESINLQLEKIQDID